MDPKSVGEIIAVMGVWVQIGGTALLLPLFALLTRHTGVRPYFFRWGWAWLALQAALLLVALRYLLAPWLFHDTVLVHGTILFLLHAGYLLAKLLHLALLVAGVWLFCRGTTVPGRTTLWLLGALLLCALAARGSRDLNQLLAVQEPIAVAHYAIGAALLLTLPRERRTLGSRFTGGIFLGQALLWALYAVGYWLSMLQVDVGGGLQLLLRYNSFFDAAAAMLLAFGMVALLLEDARQEAEAARAERLLAVALSEARLKAVLETATDAIVTADTAGRVVLFNAGAERAFGRRREQVVGQPLAELFVTASARDVVQRLEAVRRITPGKQSLFEVMGRQLDGGEIPLEVAASSLPLTDGGLDILILRDLTERRRAESDRAQLQARLAQSARTEALGRLVSGVAHELNNPLAAILTFSEQLLAEAPMPETAGPLSTIREQAVRARVIVRDLLTFVRRREERREEAEVGVLLERTVRALTADLTRQGVRLGLDLEPGLPTLRCDAPAVEQVLTNLIDNAARATPAGLVQVTVRRESDGIRITVEDDGQGIPPDHLARIFEPFFTTRGTGEGTGLGLSVSLGIVQQHGGTLEAENRLEGRGARFSAWLPLAAAEGGADPRPQPAPLNRIVPGGRVLIIDDEAPVRASLRRFFERQGWTVEEAADGTAGLARLLTSPTQQPLDLILCDLKMPGLSGLELHQWIRASRPELLSRLVFASGDTASPDTAASLSLTGRPVLEKPFELEELTAIVTRLRAATAGAA